MWFAEKGSEPDSQESTQLPLGPPGLARPSTPRGQVDIPTQRHRTLSRALLCLVTGGLAPSSQYFAQPDLWPDHVHA